MEVSKTAVAVAVIGIVGAVKYYKFKDFIDNLQLGLDVLKVSEDKASVSIKNLNTDKIPYQFESLGLVLNKETHLATTSAENTNLAIVPDAQTPINFNLLKTASKEELSNSEIVIVYKFYGFEFKRLYTPQIEVIESGKTVVDYRSKGSAAASNSPCGCH